MCAISHPVRAMATSHGHANGHCLVCFHTMYSGTQHAAVHSAESPQIPGMPSDARAEAPRASRHNLVSCSFMHARLNAAPMN